MKKAQVFFLSSIVSISAACPAHAADNSKGARTEVLGYTLGNSTCAEIKRNLSSSHPELVEGRMSDIPKNYKAITTNSSGFGLMGLTRVSMLCENDDKGTLHGVSLSFSKETSETVTEIFDKKYTKLQSQGDSALYKTPGGVLMTSSTSDDLKAIYTDMTLFQDLSDMANSMDSKL